MKLCETCKYWIRWNWHEPDFATCDLSLDGSVRFEVVPNRESHMNTRKDFGCVEHVDK